MKNNNIQTTNCTKIYLKKFDNNILVIILVMVMKIKKGCFNKKVMI